MTTNWTNAPLAITLACLTAYTPLGIVATTAAQEFAHPAGVSLTPELSRRRPVALAAGLELTAKAFTNVTIFVPNTEAVPPSATGPGTAGYFFETPASIACIYGLAPMASGCNPNTVRENAAGGSKIIAIVDAFHAPNVPDRPNVRGDLGVFSDRFGLPSPNLQVIYASGTQPPLDTTKGWELEATLDVEWAHAIAPDARLVLVEADSDAYGDLFKAVDVATGIVEQAGGGQVSLSWGGYEFATELANDTHFNGKNVIYFAATGDVPGVNYPSASTNVVAVGGTTIRRLTNGDYQDEIPWTLEGAGPSQFVHRPAYQGAIQNIVGGVRGVPDIVAVADFNLSPVWVYQSDNPLVRTNQGWIPVGGTSVATPIIAAISNNQGVVSRTTLEKLTSMYNLLGTNAFHEIALGKCGPSGIYSAAPGWDYCTGLGTPNGKSGL